MRLFFCLPLGEGAPVGTLGRMRGTPKGWKRLRGNPPVIA